MFATNVNIRVVNSVLRNYARGIQSNDSLLDGCSNVRNRNPRNLELLRIARKPVGWTLEKPGRQYWHRLVLTKSSRYVTLEVHHFENGPVISASTKEWALKKQLYKPSDSAAYINLGRLMAQRCLESGITSVVPVPNENKNNKINLLLNELKNSGMILREPITFSTPAPWNKGDQAKPWEIPL
ncbi:39S ribosomal protein L18, mitochondrial [Belonocnema kinseyi]|uniref:39S ribosomal protein L18, mitochondrial n=1 Tax=Belonocnema kinseyi TaxID=2817044 RepID=UPI00143CC294|nr:39S ribosomal protein L18, mitochondrial [Belonocnema kinseyi]